MMEIERMTPCSAYGIMQMNCMYLPSLRFMTVIGYMASSSSTIVISTLTAQRMSVRPIASQKSVSAKSS